MVTDDTCRRATATTVMKTTTLNGKGVTDADGCSTDAVDVPAKAGADKDDKKRCTTTNTSWTREKISELPNSHHDKER